MEGKRWLSSRSAESSKGPARRVYTRTRAGTRELFEWVRSGPTEGRDRLPYIGQLIALGQLGDPDETLRFLTELRVGFASRAALLDEAVAHYRSIRDTGDEALHELMAVTLGAKTFRARLEACDSAIDLIERKRKRRRSGR